MTVKEALKILKKRILAPGSGSLRPEIVNAGVCDVEVLPLSPDQLALARGYLDRRVELATGPKYLTIEITNVCNLSCIMCPRRRMTRQTGFMDFNLFRKIIDEASESVEMVYLHFMGESLLHPNLRDFIDYASSRNMTVALATNATYLTEEKIGDLLKSRLDYMLTSFDGASPEVLERVRSGAKFHAVKENVSRLLRGIRRSNPRFNAIVQIIRMPDTEKDIPGFLELWGKYPEAILKVKDLYDFGNQLDDIREMKHGSGQIPSPLAGVCYEPWRGMVIGWEGTVVPCCNDYDYKQVLGNMNTASLTEIWNGPKMKAFRERHARGSRGNLELCKTCLPPRLSSGAALSLFSPFAPALFEMHHYGNQGVGSRIAPGGGDPLFRRKKLHDLCSGPDGRGCLASGKYPSPSGNPGAADPSL
jgi:radical SAM protein with 4Fe4S-binding SPASM domain